MSTIAPIVESSYTHCGLQIINDQPGVRLHYIYLHPQFLTNIIPTQNSYFPKLEMSFCISPFPLLQFLVTFHSLIFPYSQKGKIKHKLLVSVVMVHCPDIAFYYFTFDNICHLFITKVLKLQQYSRRLDTAL